MVGLGCNNFGMTIDEERTGEVVRAALDAGINYFDTAESYGQGHSEEWLGRALGSRRDEVLVATKWGHTASLKDGERGGDPALVRRSLEASLKRLGMDHVDHYQLHRPDPDTPVDETLGVLADLAREGKISELGASAFSAAQLDEAAGVAEDRSLPPFASVQNHYSMLTRSPEADGVLDACARHGVAFVPFFPLESGLLSGKYRLGEPRPEGSRLAAWGRRGDAFIDDDKLAVVGQLQSLGRGPGSQPVGPGHELAGHQPPGGDDHRRGDPARAGAGQRGRRRLVDVGRAAGRGRGAAAGARDRLIVTA